MKNHLCFIAVFLAIAFSAFSTNAPSEWFRYTSSTYDLANYLNPLNYNYIGTTTPPLPGPKRKLYAINVDPATEKYSSGAYAGKPKVDIPGSLQSDILNATGESDGTVNEIFGRVMLGP